MKKKCIVVSCFSVLIVLAMAVLAYRNRVLSLPTTVPQHEIISFVNDGAAADIDRVRRQVKQLVDARAQKGWETVSVTIVKKWGLNNQYEGLILFKKL